MCSNPFPGRKQHNRSAFFDFFETVFLNPTSLTGVCQPVRQVVPSYRCLHCKTYWKRLPAHGRTYCTVDIVSCTREVLCWPCGNPPRSCDGSGNSFYTSWFWFETPPLFNNNVCQLLTMVDVTSDISFQIPSYICSQQNVPKMSQKTVPNKASQRKHPKKRGEKEWMKEGERAGWKNWVKEVDESKAENSREIYLASFFSLDTRFCSCSRITKLKGR